MVNIAETKKDARATFYIGCLLGMLPVAGHLVIAVAEQNGMLKISAPLPFADQNWLGHLVFFALAVGSGTLLNVLKTDRQWPWALKIGFAHLIVATIFLWLSFGLMAVAGGTPPLWAWIAV